MVKWMLLVLFTLPSISLAYSGPGGKTCGVKCCESYEVLIRGMQMPEASRNIIEATVVNYLAAEKCGEAQFGSAAWEVCLNHVSQVYGAECLSSVESVGQL